MSKKVLVISVHPDDETLGCGGTLLKHIHNGDSVSWLIMTGPTENHPYNFPKEMVLQREAEIKKVSEKYGFENTVALGFPTQLLDEVGFRELVIKTDQVIGDIKPNIVYMINRSDVHSDHRIAFQAIYSCTKNFRKPYIERMLMYETLSETEFSPAFCSTAFVPSVFIDISEFMNEKLNIMAVYKSEVMPANYPRSFSAIKALAAFRGSRIGTNYAEAFMLLFEKL